MWYFGRDSLEEEGIVYYNVNKQRLNCLTRKINASLQVVTCEGACLPKTSQDRCNNLSFFKVNRSFSILCLFYLRHNISIFL